MAILLGVHFDLFAPFRLARYYLFASLPKAAGVGNSAERGGGSPVGGLCSLDGQTGRRGRGERGCRHREGAGLPASHCTFHQILCLLHGPFQLYKSGFYFLCLRINKKIDCCADT